MYGASAGGFGSHGASRDAQGAIVPFFRAKEMN
jgi:hypothetical protein